MTGVSNRMRCFTAVIVTILLSLASQVYGRKHGHRPKARRPIVLDTSGGFSIGGQILVNPAAENETLSCGHGYVEYFIPWEPKVTSLVMWHSSSTQTFQNRWDGGEGYKDMFLRRDYPVYLWEGPGIGRANWGCEAYNYTPRYIDQNNFVAWNLGPNFMDFWEPVQFPVHGDVDEAWNQATRGRYVEFDSAANVALHSDVAAVAADSGRLGDNIVFLTNSAGGTRGLMTAIKSKSGNVRGVVMYETAGAVLPDDIGVDPAEVDAGFGPFLLPTHEFRRLADLDFVQYVWGDHRGPNRDHRQDPPDARLKWEEQVALSKLSAKMINKYGGNAEVLMLHDDAGLDGNTHIAFMDLNNDKVADLLEELLAKHGLTEYV